MTQLGNGLSEANHHEDALSVMETELSMRRRVGDSESNILVAQSNLASTYSHLGREEEALRMRQGVYSGCLKLKGEDNLSTLMAANNYASSLLNLEHYAEAKALLRKVTPVARRVLGESNRITLTIRKVYAVVLYRDDSSTPDDIREAVTTLEDTTRLARRVFGGEHPFTAEFEGSLRNAQAALAARETPRA